MTWKQFVGAVVVGVLIVAGMAAYNVIAFGSFIKP